MMFLDEGQCKHTAFIRDYWNALWNFTGPKSQLTSEVLNKVENIVAKGEIAHHEHFHLWPQCFQKSFAAILSKCVCKWERVKPLV